MIKFKIFFQGFLNSYACVDQSDENEYMHLGILTINIFCNYSNSQMVHIKKIFSTKQYHQQNVKIIFKFGVSIKTLP